MQAKNIQIPGSVWLCILIACILLRFFMHGPALNFINHRNSFFEVSMTRFFTTESTTTESTSTESTTIQPTTTTTKPSLSRKESLLKFSYNSVKLPKNYKTELVIAFTDKYYLEVAQVWINRMFKLNYSAFKYMAVRRFVLWLLLASFIFKIISSKKIFELPNKKFG